MAVQTYGGSRKLKTPSLKQETKIENGFFGHVNSYSDSDSGSSTVVHLQWRREKEHELPGPAAERVCLHLLANDVPAQRKEGRRDMLPPRPWFL